MQSSETKKKLSYQKSKNFGSQNNRSAFDGYTRIGRRSIGINQAFHARSEAPIPALSKKRESQSSKYELFVLTGM